MVDFFYSFWMSQSGVVFWHGKDWVLKFSAPKPDEKRSSLIRLQTWGQTKSPKGDSQKWWFISEVDFESTINVHSFHPFWFIFIHLISTTGTTFRQVALARGAHPVLSSLARQWGYWWILLCSHIGLAISFDVVHVISFNCVVNIN